MPSMVGGLGLMREISKSKGGGEKVCFGPDTEVVGFEQI